MAVKYIREGYRKGREGVFGRATPVVTDLKKTKQRLLLVYLGVAVLAALSLIFQMLGIGGPVAGIQVEHGEALIVAKSIVEEGTGEKHYFLDLRVKWVAPDSKQPDSAEGAAMFLDDRMEVSEAAWMGFREGSTVPVLYRIDPVRERLTVQAILAEAAHGAEE